MPARTGLSVHATGREKLKGHLAMLLFAVLIAGSFSFGGLAARFMDAEPLMLWRYIMTIAVMAALAFGFFRVPATLPKEPWRFLLLGGLIAVYMLTMFMALEFTSPVATGAVFTLMPLLSAAFALPVLGQKTRPGVLSGLIIAAAGAIWVIFRGDIDAILSFDVGAGEMIFFIGVVGHALYVPLIRRFDRGEPAVAFGFWVTVGATLPSFTLAALNGSEVTIALGEKATVINFWATWCPPCVAEMPELNAFASEQGPKVAFYAVNLREDAASVNDFMYRNGYSLFTLLDSQGAIGALFQVRYIPTTLVADREGKIVFRKSGGLNKAELDRIVNGL